MLARRRSGFTLIELLMVIVIIGVLAAIALPKFGKTRERAYFKAMMSDLRNLMAQQEVYWSSPLNRYSYAPTIALLTSYQTSSGVSVAIASASDYGWSATAGHIGLATTQLCAVFMGTVPLVPAPALTPGLIACTRD
jgi:type IV pilus assembly protein PilA